LKNKKETFLITFILAVSIAVCFGSARINKWADRKLDKFAEKNKGKSILFLDEVYFVSGEEELRIVERCIKTNSLKGGIAVYIPFYKNGGHRKELDKVINFVKTRYYLPVFVYAENGSFDFYVADKLVGKNIKTCWPMGCSFILEWGRRKNDGMWGCVLAGKASTEKEARKLVAFALEKKLKEALDEDE